MTRIWDISPPLQAESPTFPGDTPFSFGWKWRMGAGCPVNVGEIVMSPHVGAHADAPLHYRPDGEAVDALSLAPFLGACRVIPAIDPGPLVTRAHLEHAVQNMPPRVLVRTAQTAQTKAWSDHFSAFAPETVEWLSSLGVTLIGLDTPSIDPSDSKTLDSHQAIARLNMRVLENLVLDEIAEGDYELIALPLKIVGADASPVRAILRPLK